VLINTKYWADNVLGLCRQCADGVPSFLAQFRVGLGVETGKSTKCFVLTVRIPSYIIERKMARKGRLQPTKAEFRILEILWRNGPSTVRQVHEGLREETGYTSVLKLMQIMIAKGLVSRDEKVRTHVYEAALPEVEAKRGALQEIIEKVFGGSAKELIMQALSARKSSREELTDIRRMIEEMEKKKL
jgi:BlaI family penicillinase repressor